MSHRELPTTPRSRLARVAAAALLCLIGPAVRSSLCSPLDQAGAAGPAQPPGSPDSGAAGPAFPVATMADRADIAALLKDSTPLIDWLEQHNKELRAASSRLEQAEAGLRASRLYPNPALSFAMSNINAGTTNPPGLSVGDTAIYNTLLSETVEIGKRRPRIASARLERDSAAEGYLDTLGRTVAGARYALGRVVYLKARQELLEQNLASSRAVLELERARMEHGDVSGNDYDRLSLDTLALESDILRNRGAYDAALADCAAAMFAPCDPGQTRMEDLDAAADVPPDAADSESLLASRPDILSAQHERDSAHEAARLARHRAIPDLNLGVGYTRDNFTIAGDNKETAMFTAAIPVPIFDRGQHEAARQTARALELDSLAASALVSARSDLQGLLSRKAYLEKTLDTLRNESVPKSTGILGATVKAFDQGEVSMTDLLLARRTHTTLLSNFIDLRFEYFSVRNNLRQALGLDAGIARQTQKTRG